MRRVTPFSNIIRAERLQADLAARAPNPAAVQGRGVQRAMALRDEYLASDGRRSYADALRSRQKIAPLDAQRAVRAALQHRIDRAYLQDLRGEIDATTLLDRDERCIADRFVVQAQRGRIASWVPIDYCWIAAAKQMARQMPNAVIHEYPMARLGVPYVERAFFSNRALLTASELAHGNFPSGHPSGTVLEISAPSREYQRVFQRDAFFSIITQNLLELTLTWIRNGTDRWNGLIFAPHESYEEQRVTFRIPSASAFRAMLRAAHPDDPFDLALFCGIPSRETMHQIRRHELYPLTFNLRPTMHLDDSNTDEHPVIFGLHDLYHLALLLQIPPPGRRVILVLYDLLEEWARQHLPDAPHSWKMEQMLKLLTDLELRNTNTVEQLRSEKLYPLWENIMTQDAALVAAENARRAASGLYDLSYAFDDSWVACSRAVITQLDVLPWSVDERFWVHRLIKYRREWHAYAEDALYVINRRVRSFVQERDYHDEHYLEQRAYERDRAARAAAKS